MARASRTWSAWSGAALAAVVAAFSALGACRETAPRAPQARPLLEHQDSSWSRVLHSHTAGVISSRAPIRVRFVSDVGPSAASGRAESGRLAFEPPLEGAATWESARELVFVARTPLQAGVHYRARLDAQGLRGLPDGLGRYAFDFSVRPQQFELRVSGLASSAKGLELEGSVETADAADPAAVERVLGAQFGGAAAPVRWSHDADGRTHGFAVEGLARADRGAEVLLRWDGAALGVDSRGERRVEVPARASFRVQRAYHDAQRSAVVVEFSDPLDPAQDLAGLARFAAGGDAPVTAIRDTQLLVYTSDGGSSELALQLEPGIRGRSGARLEQRYEQRLARPVQKPAVRFVGKGSILPSSAGLTVPFEAANVSAVQVTAFEIYEDNLGQFLQTNALSGDAELPRVGRYLWRRTLPLDAPKAGQWTRYAIDVSSLFAERPGSVLRLTLSIRRRDAALACPGQVAAAPALPEPSLEDAEALREQQDSGWDFIEEYYGGAAGYDSWQDREDPCKDAYYVYESSARDARNFLASNLGLLAKGSDRGELEIAATDLRSAEPLAGVELEVFNYQQRSLGHATSDAQGLAKLQVKGTPFYLAARRGEERGLLKLSEGAALPTSHFDVGGEQVVRGVKGALYGERGVWRPGDTLHLTLAVEDRAGTLPPNHPATLSLYNPRGELALSETRVDPVGGFYHFALTTPEQAPTGRWQAVAQLGGLRFEERLRIETLAPNRLRVALELDADALHSARPIAGSIASRWLHGGSAAGLRSDVALELRPRPTQFTRFAGFVFDDPAREFSAERSEIFAGPLDAQGAASFQAPAPAAPEAAGMLSAHFTTRVHEAGGGFSSEQRELPLHPFDAYIGLKLPPGDAARSMLLTDTVHRVELASLSAEGEPLARAAVEVSLYKLEWKWWWDQSNESLAQYASRDYTETLSREVVATQQNGQGQYAFEIKAPAWGRYLLRACDLAGGHCTGKVFYIDWPGWAGDAVEGQGPGAHALALSTDKPAYEVGETARVKLPEFAQGRVLFSVESSAGVLERRWVNAAQAAQGIAVPISSGMAPNVYFAASLLQPHGQSGNDRPLRLYGYVPVQVSDPATHLSPLLEATEQEWSPRRPGQLRVREAGGRPMTYTLAVVDEGLLGLTGFATPDLHRAFYRREALSVRTWDLFDEVAGAYSGALERLLALGGDGFGRALAPESRPRRFPPVVVFRGPFQLGAGEVQDHEIALPQYVGEVRVMLVAGGGGAYGSAQLALPVREPLMLLPSLPRVLRPGDELEVPVSVFVTDPALRDVALRMETSAAAAGSGAASAQLRFAQPGDQLGLLPLRVGEALGMQHLHFEARGGGRDAQSDADLEVRPINPRTVRVLRRELAPGEGWETELLAGEYSDAHASLEVSSVVGLDLEARLQYLIGYPHGCLEQVTSASFPQLYLPELARLDTDQLERVRKHVQAGVERLRGFQLADGSFAYWPQSGRAHEWSNVYAGHFLLEAARHGYDVPPLLLAGWLRSAEAQARAWTAGDVGSALVQAYRLYALALAERAELGAMNRLRELALPDSGRSLLAAAYQRAGLDDAALALADAQPAAAALVSAGELEEASFASPLRDRALHMEALLALGRSAQAEQLARELVSALSRSEPYSTHSAAWALSALGRYYGPRGAERAFAFELARGGDPARRIESPSALHRVSLGAVAGSERVRLHNRSSRPLAVALAIEGVPRAGAERAAASGLELAVRYSDASGEPIDPAALTQGQDLIAELSVRNATARRRDHLALSFAVPAGWQIQERAPGAEPEPAPGAAPEPVVPFEGVTERPEQYRDVRDDAVHVYFDLEAGATARYRVALNASFAGRYYLPATRAEDMYDPLVNALEPGRWVRVERAAPDAPAVSPTPAVAPTQSAAPDAAPQPAPTVPAVQSAPPTEAPAQAPGAATEPMTAAPPSPSAAPPVAAPASGGPTAALPAVPPRPAAAAQVARR